MYVVTQSFAHLPASHIGNRMQSQTIEQLIVAHQVFPYAVDNQMQQLMLFV